MMSPIAYSRVLACYVVVSGKLRRTDCGTTSGGRDKRPRPRRRYGIVVVDTFARHTMRYRAVSGFSLLILWVLHRAALIDAGGRHE